MQHPRQVEFADRQRQHRQRASDDTRPDIRQHDRREALRKACAETGRAFFERAQASARTHRCDRAHHERQREHHMPHDDERRAHPERCKAAIYGQQRKRGGEPGQRDRQHQQFFDHTRRACLAARERIAGRHAGDKRDDERRGRHFERQEYRRVILRPHLAEPAQRQAARDAAKIIDGQTGDDRHHHRHDQKRAQRQRDEPLPGGQPAAQRRQAAHHAVAATAEPVAVRASASTTHVTTPSTIDSPAAVTRFADSVNSV